jgi:catechol 2,3-dioxygenase-like lactoylglutathione lyase family enzyme
MPVYGPVSHIDLSVGYPARSIPFYDALLSALGFLRASGEHPDFTGPSPRRAGWGMRYPDGAVFGIEVRPADASLRDRTYDRRAPGVHHIAFHAESRARVDAVHAAMLAAGATVLDPPAELSGPGYGGGYYAAFYADPDGQKLEVVHHPPTNP